MKFLRTFMIFSVDDIPFLSLSWGNHLQLGPRFFHQQFFSDISHRILRIKCIGDSTDKIR